MRELGELSGKIPRPLGEAERSMKGAVQELEGGEPGSAAEAQGDALDALQRSRRAMAEQFQRQYGRMPGMDASSRSTDSATSATPSAAAARRETSKTRAMSRSPTNPTFSAPGRFSTNSAGAPASAHDPPPSSTISSGC